MKESLVMLGKSALESKLFDEAEEYFQEAIKTDKNNPQIKILLAEAKYQQGLN
ncbi:MAG: tetratricopeptide repeat protein, partial [Promethearchaeota archaeon]